MLVSNPKFTIIIGGEHELKTIVPSASWFTAYHPYADHLQFLRDLQAGYTGNSEIITAGSSVQGRIITGIHIWGAGGKGSKPAVLIHGTVHAREWITTMTTEFLAWQLLTTSGSNATIKALVDKFDFYIMPIVNPDGFAYSQTTDRLWRKNRQTVSGNSCVGRDINRNWPYQWAATGGASTSPCSETYKGQAASDSPENRGLVAQVNSLRDSKGIRLYLDVHCKFGLGSFFINKKLILIKHMANTSFGLTDTTVTYGPTTTLNIATLRPVQQQPFGLCLEQHTHSVLVAPRCTKPLVLLLITPT
jgi:hypothetical protein